MNNVTKFVDASSAHTQQMTRLLACEDIDVIVGNYSTASFDMQRRNIHIPNWKFETRAQLDLLISHEVGHALWSPADIHDRVVAKKPGVKFVFTNVVEDIRIERKIQDKYPGLIKTYRDGYNAFIESDLFRLKGRDISTLSAIDRLNVYGKLCANTDFVVELNTAEMELYKQCYAADTVDEVVEAIINVWEYAQSLKVVIVSADILFPSGNAVPSLNGTDAPIETTFLEEETPEEETPEEETTADEEEESESDDGFASEDDDGFASEDDDGFASEDDDVTEETDEEEEVAPPEDVHRPHQDIISKEDEEEIDQEESETLDAFSHAIDDAADDSVTFLAPKTAADIDKLIRPWQAEYDKELTESSNYSRIMARYKIDEAVQQLLSGFNRLKSANEYKRGVVSNTGKIDPTKLYSYKFSDKIFQSSTHFKSGLSHGILMFIDFSGSMSHQNLMQGMLAKTLTMVKFCKKAGIKFRVVSYTLNETFHPVNYDQPELDTHDLKLVEWFNSEMSDHAFKKACTSICEYAYSKNGYTPLIESMMFAKHLLKKHQTEWAVQKMTLIVMTDGEPCLPVIPVLVRKYSDKGRVSIKIGSDTHNYSHPDLAMNPRKLYAQLITEISATGVETICFYAKTQYYINPCQVDHTKFNIETRIRLQNTLRTDYVVPIEKYSGFNLAVFYKEPKVVAFSDDQTRATGTKRLTQSQMNKAAKNLTNPQVRSTKLFVQSIMKNIA